MFVDKVRRFLPLVVTLAVLGVTFASAVTTPASAARWHYSPTLEGGMAFGPDGAFYFLDDANDQVDRVDSAGNVTVVAGKGPLLGNGGYPVFTKDHGWTEDTGYTGDGGPAVDAQLSLPFAIAFDAQGNLYISDHGNDVIRKVDTNGIITTVVGTGPTDTFLKGQWVPGVQPKGGDGGPATQGVLQSPWGITFDAQGNLYIADRDHQAIRKVDMNGIITTVAGTGVQGYSGDGGPATKAKLNKPLGVVFDAAGNMIIADENNARIRNVDTNGIITTVGGTGDVGCSGNGGPATAATVANPHGIGLGPDGSLYVSEGDCNAVRKIDTHGTILPVMGTGTDGCVGLDGGTALNAELSNPDDVTFDARGTLYVRDVACGVVVKVDSSGRSHVFLALPPG
jgi:streptogramin lyase